MRMRRQEITPAAAFVSATLLFWKWKDAFKGEKEAPLSAFYFVLMLRTLASSVHHHIHKFPKQTSRRAVENIFLLEQPD